MGHRAVATFGPIAIDHTPPSRPAQTVRARAGEPVTLRAGASDPRRGLGSRAGGDQVDPARDAREARHVGDLHVPDSGEAVDRLRFHDVAGNAGAAVVTVVVGRARGTTLRSGAVSVTIPRRTAGRVIALRVHAGATRSVRARLERRGARRPLATLRATIGAGTARTLHLHLPAWARAGAYVVRVSVLHAGRPVGHVVSARVAVS